MNINYLDTAYSVNGYAESSLKKSDLNSIDIFISSNVQNLGVRAVVSHVALGTSYLKRVVLVIEITSLI